MPLRPYAPADSLALATIKATCDLTDPLALYVRRINPDLHHHHHHHDDQTAEGRRGRVGEGEKQWKAHVKSLQRSFELEVLVPGCVCWVVYPHHLNHPTTSERDDADDGGDGEEEEDAEVVGFAIWNRHGSSPAAQKWRWHGTKVSTRLKSILNYVTMTLTYPFDTSINHSHMSNFQHRIRTAPSPFPSGQKLTLPKERWELEALYIAPQYQRRGYGMEALKWGIGVAKEEGVEVWVWSSDAGRKVYRKAGFEVLGRIGFGDLLSSNTDDKRDGEGGITREDKEEDEVAVWVMRWRDKDT